MLKAVLGGLALHQAVIGLLQVAERREKYAVAEAHARAVGKPLLVVGGPYGSNPLRHAFHFAAHGCGQYCIDLDPFACEGCPNFIEADIRDIPLPTGSMGCCFASHILEHLPNAQECERAVGELLRVADALYIAGPSKWSLVGWLVPEHWLWVRQRDSQILIQERLEKTDRGPRGLL